VTFAQQAGGDAGLPRPPPHRNLIGAGAAGRWGRGPDLRINVVERHVSDGPLFAYRGLKRAGTLRPDPAQELAAEKLQSLYNAVRRYRPSTGPGGWKERLGLGRRREAPPQGLYLYGGVGRGKSMLMDLFFDAAPVEAKRRVHFHAFMLEVHERIHAWRKGRGRGAGDPIPPLAESMAAEAWLLCFDEFHVTNIADAMILGRLFTRLFEHGVVAIATSNRAPDELYKDGLQRQRFLPFIGMLQERLDVLHLAAERDYRLDRLRGMTVYHTPLGAAASKALAAAFAELTSGVAAHPETLRLKGRTLQVSRTAMGVACFGFAELCRRPLGAADYLAIAQEYHTVIVDGVPRLEAKARNEASRFSTLIDALYEHRVNLICAAAAPPHELYIEGTGAFEFQRTASRLIEMQAADYMGRAHVV